MTMRGNKNAGTVYSTEHGRMCPDCDEPLLQCSCDRGKILPSKDGIVRVGRETKGRKGKGVTIVTCLSLGLDDLRDLAKGLKQKCGSGGTVKAGVIEIQGDHRDAVALELKAKGYRVKMIGG